MVLGVPSLKIKDEVYAYEECKDRSIKNSRSTQLKDANFLR